MCLCLRICVKQKWDFKLFPIDSKNSWDFYILVILFFLGAVGVFTHLYLGICCWQPQGLTAGLGSAPGVTGGEVGDSIPQAESSLSIPWRDPNWFSDRGTHSQSSLRSNWCVMICFIRIIFEINDPLCF